MLVNLLDGGYNDVFAVKEGSMEPCRKCGALFNPSPCRIRDKDYLCQNCARVYWIKYRDKRMSLGLSISGTSIYNEKKKESSKLYTSRPEIKKRITEYQKKYRNDPLLKHRHYTRWIAQNALRGGKINKSPCGICGSKESQMHHADYDKPLEITWLCRPCHYRLHSAARGK